MPRVKNPLDITSKVARITQNEQPGALEEITQILKKALGCKVVSIYACAEDSYLLIANQGFSSDQVGKLILKKGRGLVDHIVAKKKTLCVSDATSHPAFYYVQGLGEEKYHGFIGSPIFQGNKTSGVLIFQFTKKYDSSLDDIALIETIAQQIAHLVKLPDQTKLQDQSNSKLVARGVCSGTFHGEVLKKLIMEDSPNQTSQAPGKGYEHEKKRLEEAHLKAKNFLEELKAKAPTKETVDILNAHVMMMMDPQLKKKEEVHLKNNASAEQAVSLAASEISEMFKNISDPYIQQRAMDVIDVGRRVYNTLSPSETTLKKGEHKKVVIANKLPPSILIEEGPMLYGALLLVEENLYSHNIILAKSMGIPTVIISKEQLQILSNTKDIFVDGELGLIMPSPSRLWVKEYTRSRKGPEEQNQKDYGPCLTKNGTEIHLAMNGGFLKDTENLPPWIPEIGLFRTEFQFFMSQRMPTEEHLTENYTKILLAADGRPTTLRILDAGADKQPPCLHFVHEDNPALGDRSIRYLLKNSDIIFSQLRAMLKAQAATGGNLRILIPMVTVYEEVSRIRDHIIKVLRDLRREGINVKCPPIGAMIEVPSSVNLIPKIAPLIDFLCVGTNDLLQYFVAADRTNALVQYLYKWHHPSFLVTLKGIAKSSTEANCPVSICGEMAGEMWGSLVLVALGFRHLSMDRQAIARHYELMAHVSIRSLERLVTRLIQHNTGLEILEQLQLYLDKWVLPDDLKGLLQSELNNMINPS
jgi:phosphoenolpyruvate-protein phosphotransferase